MSVLPVSAQQVTANEKSDTVKYGFKERFGVHTNTLGWVLMTPNVGFEYDVYRTDKRKFSLLVSGRYNWDMSPKFKTRYLYNIAGGKLEARWYFRTRQRQDWETEMVNSTEGFFNRLWKKRRYITARQNPRTHRAYYIGPYVGYDNFSLKLSDTGWQGSALGAGVSFGVNTPLYLYENGSAIDLELGVSVGVLNVDYEEFGYNSEDKCYAYKGEESKFLPYPVVSDLRLALVYRMDPIKNQIVAIDEEKLDYEKRTYDLRNQYLNRYDDIWGQDVLPAGYNGKFAFPGMEDADSDSPEYKRAVARYKDSVADAHYARLAKLNSEILEYNEEVKKDNEVIAEAGIADSSMYLKELHPAYKYIEIPGKLVNKGSKIQFHNKYLTSLEELNELDINFFSELMARYSLMDIDTLLFEQYNARVQYMRDNQNDSVTPILYYDMLVNAVPNLNIEIQRHNNNYIFSGGEQSASDSVKYHRFALVRQKNAFYMNSQNVLNANTMNDDIRMGNEELRRLLKDSLNLKLTENEAEKRNRLLQEQKMKAEEKAAEEKRKLEEEAAKEAAKLEKERLKAEEKAAKAAAKAEEERLKAEAKAAKEAAKAEKKSADADEDNSDVLTNDANENMPASEAASENTTDEVDENASVEEVDEKAAAKAEKERLKAEAKAAKEAAKAEKERLKAEAKAAKEAAKAEKERLKAEAKAAKEAAKAEKERLKEEAEAAKEQESNEDANTDSEKEE